MGYYIRVLGERDEIVSRDQVATWVQGLPVEIELDGSLNEDDLLLRHKNGVEIAVVERNPVVEGELGAEELDEFRAELVNAKPQSAADWLRSYFDRIRIIYAFQVLSGTDHESGWDAVHKTQEGIWKLSGGILQADREGFSNPDGHHILWQFSDSAHGEYSMAVLDSDGGWIPFKMDLGNAQHRAAFLEGRVPTGVKLL